MKLNIYKQNYQIVIEYDGSKFVGKYRHGKRHGPGTYTFLNGEGFKGVWENDELKVGTGDAADEDSSSCANIITYSGASGIIFSFPILKRMNPDYKTFELERFC